MSGSDRIESYRKELKHFIPTKYIEDHDYSPVIKDKFGNFLLELIETPRLFSGVGARELAKKVDFDKWIKEVIPKNIDDVAIKIYQDIYYKLQGGKVKEDQEESSLLPEEEDKIQEISAMNAGAVSMSSYKNLDRDEFIQELKLRRLIRESIKIYKKNHSQQKFEEEQKFRGFIKNLILKEAEEDRPHRSTRYKCFI